MNAISPSADFARPAFYEASLSQAVADAHSQLALAKAIQKSARTRSEARTAARNVKRALAAVTKAERAVKHEERAETLAPSIQRQPIVHNGVVLRDARIEVQQGKRAELQASLERLRARGSIGERCYNAGRDYREAWEKAGRDLYPVAMGNEGGKSAPASGNRRIEEAVGSSLELDAARKAIGKFGSAMLEHIIVEGLSLAAWSEKHGVSEHVARGILIMVLERLAEHFEQRRGSSRRLEKSSELYDIIE